MTNMKKHKMEFMLPKEEFGAFLRRLGGDLDDGRVHVADADIALASVIDLKVTFESEGEDCLVKLKVRSAEDAVRLRYEDGAFVEDREGEDAVGGDDAGTPAPKAAPARKAKGAEARYEELKERMDVDFKAMRRMLELGSLPDLPMVERFAKDSAAMISFKGKGDEHYAEYEAAVRAFRDAAAAQDAERTKACMKTLRQLKRSCHDRYK